MSLSSFPPVSHHFARSPSSSLRSSLPAMVSFTQATLALLALASAASAAPAAVAAPFRPAAPGRRDLEPRRAKIVPKVMIVSLVSCATFLY